MSNPDSFGLTLSISNQVQNESVATVSAVRLMSGEVSLPEFALSLVPPDSESCGRRNLPMKLPCSVLSIPEGELSLKGLRQSRIGVVVWRESDITREVIVDNVRVVLLATTEAGARPVFVSFHVVFEADLTRC